MANRAKNDERGGLGFLYDPEKGSSSREKVSLDPNSNPKYDTCEESGFIKHAFILTFYYLLIADQY